jgi:hypothetical protein
VDVERIGLAREAEFFDGELADEGACTVSYFAASASSTVATRIKVHPPAGNETGQCGPGGPSALLGGGDGEVADLDVGGLFDGERDGTGDGKIVAITGVCPTWPWRDRAGTMSLSAKGVTRVADDRRDTGGNSAQGGARGFGSRHSAVSTVLRL